MSNRETTQCLVIDERELSEECVPNLRCRLLYGTRGRKIEDINAQPHPAARNLFKNNFECFIISSNSGHDDNGMLMEDFASQNIFKGGK